MNIIQAVKSGRPYKRKNMETYCSPEKQLFYELTIADILSEDWIIEEPKVEVTATMISEAISKLHDGNGRNLSDTIDFIKKELGL